ncbi:hypothetical protein JQ614_45015 [Bradyrhizobium diazoefficiens]|uniref:hypothetical protein n=1 Tax=Bradyrhizobium diazoefficiens TaxID=1355477 RepID=UPI001B8C6A4E|nr:hypothetical protein [Bradyrhizobium diazoefficiens]MBR0868545.1 hypothetical protein [Bradyrhizobium diazoefficiens]MBR0893077.1 hypothetical protein [Bradyrhizobium diazoefficiens]MBR0924795.1 hypothetical protein [Bradyrhizobium diazoefficiens]
MTATNLQLVLDALRSFNDHIVTHGDLSPHGLTNQMRLERLIADRVMFNAGWHAAKGSATDELRGAASTDKLLPILLKIAENSRDYAAASKRLAEASAALEQPKKMGRRPGSYEGWHFEPGYSVVVAMIETEPGKKLPDHVRWAVREGWLKKDIPDRTHLRKIGLIRQRLAAEDAARLAAMGANVVPFKPRRKPQKRAK